MLQAMDDPFEAVAVAPPWSCGGATVIYSGGGSVGVGGEQLADKMHRIRIPAAVRAPRCIGMLHKPIPIPSVGGYS